MIVLALLVGAAFLLWRFRRSVRGPSLDKVPGPKPASFLTGNVLQLVDRQGWDFHAQIARTYGAVVKLSWMFGKPMLYVFDPVALSHIVKDTATFEEPPWYIDGNCMMFGPGLVATSGDTHRKQRKMVTPVFSPNHLRTLVPIFYQITDRLVDAISARLSPKDQATDVDILNWMGRAALELIGQTGIGYSFDPLTSDVPDDYADAIKHLAPVATSPEMILLRQLLPFVKDIGPTWLRRWLLERIPMRNVKRIIKITDTIHKGSLKVLMAKKAAIEAGGDTDQKDLMSILLRANMAASEEDRLPDDQLLGQMSSIIFAAMDTTSNTLARTLQLLAEQPDVQTKLRREILDAKGDSAQLDYERLHALPYLDAVCRETLRLFPAGIHTFRCAEKDTVLPLSQPIRATDGTMLTELPVPRGTNIFVAIMACNRNPALWGPDADDWKPERWLKPLPGAVESAAIPGVYANLMTFLGGGRSCVGFTFSQLEMKVVLSELLVNFAFERSDKPIVWNISGVVYPSVSYESTKSELWLKVRKL